MAEAEGKLLSSAPTLLGVHGGREQKDVRHDVVFSSARPSLGAPDAAHPRDGLERRASSTWILS